MILSLVSFLTFGLCVVSAQKVKVTSALTEPYTYLKSTGGYEGFIPDILEKIFGGKDYFELSIVEGGKYGQKDAMGNWSGMIGNVKRGEADMAAADITVTVQRMEAVAFSNPFDTFSYAALMTKALKLNKNINSFDDLLKHSDIKFGVASGGLTQLNLKESKRVTYMKIYSEMQKTPAESFVSSNIVGLQKVRRAGENFVLILEAPLSEYLANQLPCDLTVVVNQGDDLKHAFALNKNDTMLLKKVNDKLAALGDLTSLKDKWWKKNCNDTLNKDSGNNGKNFALKNVSGSFAMILLAYLVRSLA